MGNLLQKQRGEFDSTNSELLPGLTKNQKEIWLAFNDTRNWKPPSFRDVMYIVGKKNVNSITDAVKRIEEKGYNIPKRDKGYYGNNNAKNL